MGQHQIVLFVIVPMAAGILCLLAHGRRMVQRLIGVGALLLNIYLGITAIKTVIFGNSVHILVSQMGNWPAPFGITIAVDPLSAVMLTFASIVCLAVYIYCIGLGSEELEGGFFHALFHLQLFGVNWSFVTGDLFNLFVAFEIMLMASYAIFCISGSRAQMLQIYKYVLLNLVGSTLFVICAGLLYGQLGTLNMADITRQVMHHQIPTTAYPVIALMLVVFGSKTAMFPLWYWLPDTYHTLPAPIGGLFAGLLTKVGAYVMIRVFIMMFGMSEIVSAMLSPIILFAAGVTMFVGVLGAVSMHSVRRILSIHIISQVGYMILGIGLGMGAVAGLSAEAVDLKVLAVAGSIFFVLHNMIVKCCLFLCGGLMTEYAGSDDLNKIGGLLKKTPWLATLFLIAALSLAGLPPLSGFFGKWILIKSSFATGHYVVVGLAIVTSLFTLLSMLKIWSYGFWSPAQGRHVTEPHRQVMGHGGMLGITLLVGMALSMGLAAPFYYKLCDTAARYVVQPQAYVTAVLGPYADEPREVARKQADNVTLKLARANSQKEH